jgi:hypothetical protein
LDNWKADPFWRNYLKEKFTMPRGASPKREKEYKELKSKFKKEHRYAGREEEVASRIVNKQRAQYGETKSEKKQEKQGKSPDKDLPIQNYRHLTIPQIESKLPKLSSKQKNRVKEYEKKHKNRKTLLEAMK